jgi:hypothetical protein
MLLYAAGVVFAVLYCTVCVSVLGGGAAMGVAGYAVPVCARTTGSWAWTITGSVAVSPAWCPDCRRLRE